MGPIATGFGIACWLTLGLTMAAALMQSRGLQVFGAAAFVFAMFWASRAVSASLGPPWSMAHYPAQDAAMIGLLWFTWGHKSELWKLTVAWLLLLQLGFHATYWLVWLTGGHDVETLRTYILLNNVGMAGILLTLSLQGALIVLAGLPDLFAGDPVFHRGSVAKYPRAFR